MQTNTVPLFRLLLDLLPESHYKIARDLGLTSCNLSRLCNGLTSRQKSLERAADYLSQRTGCALDSSLLKVNLDAKSLVAAALYLRSEKLRRTLRQNAEATV